MISEYTKQRDRWWGILVVESSELRLGSFEFPFSFEKKKKKQKLFHKETKVLLVFSQNPRSAYTHIHHTPPTRAVLDFHAQQPNTTQLITPYFGESKSTISIQRSPHFLSLSSLKESCGFFSSFESFIFLFFLCVLFVAFIVCAQAQFGFSWKQ